MATKSGGYAIVKYDDVDIFAKVKNAFENEKPILFYDDDKTCYYIDAISINGDGDYVLIKGGKTFTITDNNTVSSTGSVDAPTMENIKDLNGNLRFQEWDIDTTNVKEGITISYGKVSLSGTHLMFVLAGTIADTTALANGDVFGNVVLPSFIMDKIYRVWSVNAVESKTCALYDDNWGVQSCAIVLIKQANDIVFKTTSTITMNTDRSFRIQFDLLIDAE